LLQGPDHAIRSPTDSPPSRHLSDGRLQLESCPPSVGTSGRFALEYATLSTLVDTIDAQRQQGNLSSALRLFVLEFYRGQIPEVETREGFRELMERPKAVAV
jgi:hypothetical protein